MSLPIDERDRVAIKAAVRDARRAYRAFARDVRDDAGSLTPYQLSICEAHLGYLARERIAAENEAEDYGVKVPRCAQSR